MVIKRLEFPLAKAEYLLSHTTAPGEGGDKRKLWGEVLGFDSAESVREAILAQIDLDTFEMIGPNSYGNRYQLIVLLKDTSDRIRHLRTIWIVLTGETVARFVTAVPHKSRGN